jgi:hypothetical protein
MHEMFLTHYLCQISTTVATTVRNFNTSQELNTCLIIILFKCLFVTSHYRTVSKWESLLITAFQKLCQQQNVLFYPETVVKVVITISDDSRLL